MKTTLLLLMASLPLSSAVILQHQSEGVSLTVTSLESGAYLYDYLIDDGWTFEAPGLVNPSLSICLFTDDAETFEFIPVATATPIIYRFESPYAPVAGRVLRQVTFQMDIWGELAHGRSAIHSASYVPNVPPIPEPGTLFLTALSASTLLRRNRD